MKKTIQLIIVLLILSIGFSLTGCMDRCKTEVLRYYITHYSVSRDITLHSDLNNKNLYEITISFSGEEVVSYSSQGKKLETFKELARKNGDTSYKEVIECANLSPMPVRCFLPESVSGINITCDKDVDQHPAGTSLNDLFLFLTFSPDKYIKNGYKPLNIDKEKELKRVDNRFKVVVSNFFNSSGASSEMVYGTLSEIDFSRYKLLGIPNNVCAEFSWITPPTNLSNYTLTVEIEFVDGVKKTASIAVAS